MPAEALLLALLNIPVFMFGVFVARRVIDRKHVDERRRLEAEMMGKVRERYRAYLELEQQVEHIFKRLDELEAATDASLQQTGMHLQHLGQAVAAYEGGEPVEDPGPIGGALDWMGEEPMSIHVSDAQDYPAGIQEWEAKLESLREEKRLEIERQGEVISALTTRLNNLSKSEAMGRVERELQLWQQKYMNLERASTSEVAEILNLREESEDLREQMVALEESVAKWKKTNTELSAESQAHEAELRARITELEPHVEAAEFARREAAQWSARCQEESAGRQQAVESYEQRIAQLEPMRETIASMEVDRASLQQTLSARDGQVRDLAGRLEESRERLGGLEANDANQRAQIARLEERVRALQIALREQESQVASWRSDCEEAVKREVQNVERVGELETEGQRLSGALSALSKEHEAASERLHATESALQESKAHLLELEQRFAAELAESRGQNEEALRDLDVAREACDALKSENERALRRSAQLDEEVNGLRSVNEDLQRELEDASRNVQGQDSRISNLMSDLEGVRREAESKSSLVDAAESVLSELRPKLEALESQLHRKND